MFNKKIHKRIKITLQERDSDILNKILEEMQTNSPISIKEITTTLPNGNTCHSKVAEINICSNVICNSLEKYGITKNKTYTGNINIELIPKEFHRDLLRGIVDGDGSFGIYCGSSGQISYDALRLVGNINTLNLVRDILKEETGIDSKIYSSERYNEDIKELNVSGKTNLKIILDYLYKDSELFLNRKYNKYLKIIQVYELIMTKAPKGVHLLSEKERENIKQIIKSINSNDYPAGEYI